MQRWLAGRRLGEGVLRANRVGADPGPRALPREHGLPRGGPAVVFPLLDPEGRVLYLQARYLQPNGRKYDNPSADLVPASPRLGEIRLPGPADRNDLVVVCEGVPDALTAAGAGYRAVAVLGAGLPDERLAAQLVARHPRAHLIVAFDADDRGRTGSERLIELLETLAYQHLLLDDQAMATGNLEEIVRTLASWHSGAEPIEPKPDGQLRDALERISYGHLLVDHDDGVQGTLGKLAEAVHHWAHFLPHRTRGVPDPTSASPSLELPASLLPEPSGAWVEGPDLGL